LLSFCPRWITSPAEAEQFVDEAIKDALRLLVARDCLLVTVDDCTRYEFAFGPALICVEATLCDGKTRFREIEIWTEERVAWWREPIARAVNRYPHVEYTDDWKGAHVQL